MREDAGADSARKKAERKPNPGCISCHQGIETMHPWDPLSCTDCHGGDGDARTMEAAHVAARQPVANDERTVGLRHDLAYRRFLNPTDLRVSTEVCGRCHESECSNLEKSLHGTTAGHLSDGLYENGVMRDKAQRFSIFPVKDTDGTVPDNAYKSMPGIPAVSVDGDDRIGKHFSDLPRKSCMQCHLYSRGVGLRGRLGQDGWYRGEGCASCHVLYAHDGLSLTNDPTVDKLEPGHAIAHRMTSKIPTETCTTCHALDANIGMSFRGLGQLPPGVPGGPDVPGTTDKLSKGRFFLRDEAICPPDVHYERGMACIDCHTGADVMGDGNIYGFMEDAVGIRCETCHGTFSAKATLKTKNGGRLDHIKIQDGIAYLTGKIDGKRRRVKQVVDVLNPRHEHHNKRAKAAMDPVKHGRLTCYACHSGWSVNFFGFHFDRNEAFTQLDILSGQRTTGRVTTQEKIFATFRHYYLGFDSHGKIAPYMVGFSTTGSAHDKNGETYLRQELPVTAKNLSGMTLIHHQLHTVRPAARRCVECHAAPSVLGLGSENFHLFRDLFVVVGDAGLVVCGFDVKSPDKSVAIANVDLPSLPRHVALLNNRLTGRAEVAYVASQGGSVQIVDVTKPVRPKRVGSVNAGDARRVHIREGHMFVAAGRDGLLIYDIKKPRRPRLLAKVATTEARAVFIDGIYAYVADGPAGLRIVDVSRLDKPALTATFDLNGGNDSRPNGANDVLVHFTPARPDVQGRRRTRARNVAYVADSEGGLYLVDVSRPEKPRRVPNSIGYGRAFQATALAFASNYDIGSAGGDIVSAERDYLYVVSTSQASSNGDLFKMDVTDPEQIRLTGRRRTVTDPRGVRIARVYQPPFLKQFAIVAGRANDSVEITDVSDRSNLTAAGVVEGTGRVVGVDIESFPLDRLVGLDDKPLKDVSHPRSRYLTRKEIERILRVELK